MSAILRAFLLLSIALAACGKPAPAVVSAGCSQDARFTARTWGDLRVNLDWAGAALDCDGMPRPYGEGARLRFAGPVDTGNEMLELAFIVAMPGLEPGVTASELAATVTLMQENDGRFYSTGGSDICWADITRHARIDSDSRYAIAGIVYCVAPLPETRGDGSVVLRDVAFTGRVDWSTPE